MSDAGDERWTLASRSLVRFQATSVQSACLLAIEDGSPTLSEETRLMSAVEGSIMGAFRVIVESVPGIPPEDVGRLLKGLVDSTVEIETRRANGETPVLYGDARIPPPPETFDPMAVAAPTKANVRPSTKGGRKRRPG